MPYTYTHALAGANMHQAVTLGRVAEKPCGSTVEICGAEKAVKQTHPGLWPDAGHEVADYRMCKG